MTNKILEFIANETNGKCYQSFRYCADDEIRMPTLDYEDKDKSSEFSLVKNSYGETDTGLKETKSLKDKATKIINSEPLFHYRTPAYKYKSEIVGNVYFAIWYVRVREKEHSAKMKTNIKR